MKRRDFLRNSSLAGLGAMAALYLPGCSSVEKEEILTELRLLQGSHLDFMGDWMAHYNNKYGIKVNVDQITTMDLSNRLSSAFVARTSPWDVVFTSSEVVAPIAAQGWLKDLTDKAKNSHIYKGNNTLVEIAAKSGHFGNQIVGLPIHIGCPIMIYNKKMMEERDLDPNAPANWHEKKNSYDDFLEYAKKMTFEKNGVNNYGFIDNWAGVGVMWTYKALVQMHGGDLVDQDENPIMNSEACVEALEKMVDLLHTHKCVDPASMTYTWVFDGAPPFLEGRRGIFITWPFLVGVANGDDSAIKGNVGFAPNFSVDTSAHADGSEFYSIPIFTKNEEEAWNWIEVVTSYEYQKIMGETTGWFPIYEEVLEEPTVIANNPVAPVLRKAYQYPANNYFTANSARWSNILIDSVHRALNQRETPKDALNNAVREIKEALK